MDNPVFVRDLNSALFLQRKDIVEPNNVEYKEETIEIQWSIFNSELSIFIDDSDSAGYTIKTGEGSWEPGKGELYIFKTLPEDIQEFFEQCKQ